MKPTLPYPCGGADHFSRRTLLKAAGVGGLAWLTPLAELLALEAADAPKGKPARSVILLWLAGGPSQLETFDPHPGTGIAAGTGAIKTALKGIQFAPGLEETAGVMGDVSLIRSMVSKEGDHERAIYNLKTGYRPNPTLVHPSIGAILCHELPDARIEIPTHISILPNQWPARGGFFGADYDAFQVDDPTKPVPDVTTKVALARQEQRLGEVRIYAGGKLVARRPLVAARSIAKPGFVGRSEWYAGRTLHHIRSWFS